MKRTPTWYKFHDSRYTPSWLSGQIRISSLDYFAYRQWPGGDDQIGDRLEAGAQMTSEEPMIWDGEHAPANAGWLRENRIVAYDGTDTTLRIEGLKVILADDPAHVLCLSEGDFTTCSEYWLGEGYNAAVQISDAPALAYALWKEGHTPKGTPLSQIFGEPTFNWVTYGDKLTDLSQSTLPIRGPFSKPRRLAPQAEYRICWPQIEPRVRDQLDVILPRPERFILRKLDGPEVTETRTIKDSTGLLNNTRGLWEEYSKWERNHPTPRPLFGPQISREDAISNWQEACARRAAESTSLFELRAKQLIWRWRLDGDKRFNLASPYDEGGATMLWLQILASGRLEGREIVDLLD